MSNQLQTILFGTFMPPIGKTRSIRFDGPKQPMQPHLNTARSRRASDKAEKQALLDIQTLVTQLLKEHNDAWFTVPGVSRQVSCSFDTATRHLNALVTSRIATRRKGKSNGGRPGYIYKWINHRAQK